MVSLNYDFSNKRLRLNGQVITQKLYLCAIIKNLLAENGYEENFFTHPPIPLLVNYEDVSYDSLYSLLRHIYDYCICYNFPCLTPTDKVVVTSSGVCPDYNSPRFVIIELCADGYFENFPVPMCRAAYEVTKWLSIDNYHNKVVIIR